MRRKFIGNCLAAAVWLVGVTDGMAAGASAHVYACLPQINSVSNGWYS